MLQIIPEKKNTKLVITLIVIFVALAVFIIFLPSILSSAGIKLVNIVTYAFILVEYILLLSAFLLLERYILFKVRYVIKVNVDRLDDDGVAGEYEPLAESGNISSIPPEYLDFMIFKKTGLRGRREFRDFHMNMTTLVHLEKLKISNSSRQDVNRLKKEYPNPHFYNYKVSFGRTDTLIAVFSAADDLTFGTVLEYSEELEAALLSLSGKLKPESVLDENTNE